VIKIERAGVGDRARGNDQRVRGRAAEQADRRPRLATAWVDAKQGGSRAGGMSDARLQW
jgi:hypothetical protein